MTDTATRPTIYTLTDGTRIGSILGCDAAPNGTLFRGRDTDGNARTWHTSDVVVGPADPDCPTCHGSAWDDAFMSSCSCTRPRVLITAHAFPVAADREMDTRPGDRLDGKTYGRTMDGPTERQTDYYARLCAERGTPDLAAAVDEFRKLSKAQASKAIDAVLKLPRVPVETTAPVAPSMVGTLDLSALPSGRYAVPGGSRLKVQVDNVTEGQWAGWVFVKDAAEYGRGKRYGRQRPRETYEGQIQTELAAILADPRAAAIAYGHLTGTCGLCGIKLENEESIAYGIGPVCRRKAGW